MASGQSTVDYLLAQTAHAGRVQARKMFGEFGLYCDDKLVGLICDGQLFVKPTAAGEAWLGELVWGTPYPGAKPAYLIDGTRWDDGDWLTELIRRTATALAPPKRRRKS